MCCCSSVRGTGAEDAGVAAAVEGSATALELGGDCDCDCAGVGSVDGPGRERPDRPAEYELPDGRAKPCCCWGCLGCGG